MKGSITNAQISKIHVLLSQLKLMPEKKNFVRQFTKGRSESTKEMNMDEAKLFIQALSKYDPCDLMRRKVFHLAYEAHIIWGDSSEDKKLNAIKLNQFILSKGTVKKELNRMNNLELVKTVTQFQQIVKHIEYGNAGKQTDELLAELNISRTRKNHSGN